MKKILTIEDDRFLRQLIQKKLADSGFEALSASDGESGLTLIKEQKPDLVLLDLILPGIDGFEVLATIKKDPETKDIPVIILSNLGQEGDVNKGVEYGAVDYMVKAHFTPNEIVEKVKQSLGEPRA